MVKIIRKTVDELLNDRRHVPPGNTYTADTTFVYPLTGNTYTVVKGCASTHGRWYCVPHDLTPVYQLDAEYHGTPSCSWVWICYKHVEDGVVEEVKRRRK